MKCFLNQKRKILFFLAPAKSKINPTNTSSSSSSKSLIISSLHKQYRLFFLRGKFLGVSPPRRKMFRNEYIFFSEPKLYSCSFCQKPSDTAWDLVQHVQTSHGRFSFHSCQAIFPDYKVNISRLSLYSPQCKYSPRNHSRSLCYCMKVFKSALRERRKPTWPLPLSGLRVEP